MLDLSFRVKLHDVKASQLTSPHRTPTALPFFRLDFDGKIVQSPLCEAVGDPNWGKHKSSFEYRLQEPDLEAAIQSLSNRSATMAIYFVERTGENEVLVGSCTIDLFTVCTGAVANSFDIHSPESGKVSCGKVNFMLAMEQQCVVGLSFADIQVSGLPKPTPAVLRYNFISDPDHVQQSGTSVACLDPSWTNIPKILVRTTLRGLLDNTLRIFIGDVSDGQKPMAHVDVPLGETVQSNCNHTAKVTRNAYAESTYHKNFTALVQGMLNFTDVPVFAQFLTGSNTNGSVYGRPLMESCPLPPRYTKISSTGIAAAAGSEQVKMPAHHAPPDSTQASNIVSPNPAAEAPPIPGALLPTPRDNYTTYGGTQPTPGFHQSLVSATGNPPVRRDDLEPPVDTVPELPRRHDASSIQPPSQLPTPVAPNTSTISNSIVAPQTKVPTQHSAAAVSAAESFLATKQALQYESRTISPSKRRPVSPPRAVPNTLEVSGMVVPNPQSSAGGSGPSIRPAIPRSPLGPIADQLHRQHEEAQGHIIRQQQHVSALKEELAERTEREERISTATLEMLTKEETQARDEMHSLDRQIKELGLAEEQAQVEHAMSLKQFRATKNQLEMELQELLEVEAQLLALQRSVSVHAEEQARAAERARLEAMDAHQKTARDAELFAELDDRWVRRRDPKSTSPSRPRPPTSVNNTTSVMPHSVEQSHQVTVGANVSAAPLQQQQQSVTHQEQMNSTTQQPYQSYTQHRLGEARNLDQIIQQQQQQVYSSPYHLRSKSPTRAGSGPSSQPPGTTTATTTVLASQNDSSTSSYRVPGSSTMTNQPNAAIFVDNLKMAIRTGNAAEFSATLRDFPPAIHKDHSFLNLALNAKDGVTNEPLVNVEIVTMILSSRPELMNTVDSTSGNTPLHTAAALTKPGVGLPLVELFTSRGASANGSFNRDGLSPYHVALLNTSEEGKLIRRFFLFKGGVDINQPTAQGESPAHIVSISDRFLASLTFLKDHGATLDSLAQCRDGDNKVELMTPAQKARMYGDAALKIQTLLGAYDL